MISAEEIAAALDDVGLSNVAVARDLGCGAERVRRVRAAAGIPPYRRGRRRSYESWPEAFVARTVAVDGGHVEWLGPVSRTGTPLLRLGAETQTAYRYVFRVHHGRDPEGNAAPGCDFPGCVAGAHLEDWLLREQRRARGGST
ncbi:hypothetical protein [Streptomyces sp. NPDC007346]|uniref:hypothetical protein n=1 Tax=Streptomyces sp. NPDC007346 TaxID=3154682 RepID=UPI003455D370